MKQWTVIILLSLAQFIMVLDSTVMNLSIISQNLATLLVGWSVIEGIGAILVIPAIASLIVANYTGKQRALAYGILGAVAGAAAAVGPLIGGFATTYFSWRYVFVAETIAIICILFLSTKLKPTNPRKAFRSTFLVSCYRPPA